VPQWAAGAFGNQVRFAARFNCSDAAFPPTHIVTYTTEYNQSPTDIIIGTNEITINKSGLYHIQGLARYLIDYSGNPQPTNNPYADLTFFLGSTAFTPAQTEPIGFTKNNFFQKSIPFSQDYYIAAPAAIRVYATIGAFQTNYSRIESSGIITGYLISE